MAAETPPPYRPENGMVDLRESLLARHVSVVSCPPPEDWVEQSDQHARADVRVLADDTPDLSQKVLRTLL